MLLLLLLLGMHLRWHFLEGSEPHGRHWTLPLRAHILDGREIGRTEVAKDQVEHRTLEVFTFRVFHLRSFSVGVRLSVILVLFVGVREFSIF